MPRDDLSHLVADAVEQHRPAQPPPFEALVRRWRRRRTTRRAASAAVVVAAVALTASVVLATNARGPAPHVADTPRPTVSGPAGPIPYDVTGVSACLGTDCRTVTDVDQVRLLVADLNAGKPVPADPGRLTCAPDPAGITLTFTGPHEPYPVVDVLYKCDWWKMRGDDTVYVDWAAARTSAHQAQRHGLVVHDCGVTTGYFGAEYRAPDYVGLTLDESRSRARERGYQVRVLGEDGQCAGATDDLRQDRVNVYLENGRVKTAAFG